MHYGWHGTTALFNTLGSQPARVFKAIETASDGSYRAQEMLCEYFSDEKMIHLLSICCTDNLPQFQQRQERFQLGNIHIVDAIVSVLRRSQVLPRGDLLSG